MTLLMTCYLDAFLKIFW